MLDLGNYQNLLNIEASLLRGNQEGYSQRLINKIKEVKYIDLNSAEKKHISEDEVCSICHDSYSNTENIKILA